MTSCFGGRAKHEVTSIHCERYIQIAWVDVVDTGVPLIGCSAVGTCNDSLNVGSAVVAVGYKHLNLGSVHCCEPASPVGISLKLCANMCTSVITATPTLVVGTYYCILGCCLCCIAKDNIVVVPVACTRCVVGEFELTCCASRKFYVVCAY